MKTSNLNFASLALSISVLFAGACAPEVSKDNSQSKYSQLSNGPDLPEECRPCWEDFQGCLADGSDVDACGDNIIDCTQECQAPPPPDACLHCSSGFDACAANAGDNVGDCASGFEGCLSACEGSCENTAEGCLPYCDGNIGIPDNPNEDGGTNDRDEDRTDPTGEDGTAPGDDSRNCIPEPPPLDDANQCEAEYDRCFDDLWGNGSNDEAGNATSICDEILNGCYDDCPDDDEHSCEAVFQECLGSDGGTDPQDPDAEGQNRSECEQLLNDCLDSEIPPPEGEEPPLPTEPNDPNDSDASRPLD